MNYRPKRPCLFLPVAVELLPEGFTDECDAHPRVYLRAPSWGELQDSAASDDAFSLQRLCVDGHGGDFGLCRHEVSRTFTGEIFDLAIPDLGLLAMASRSLATVSAKEAGESDAPAA